MLFSCSSEDNLVQSTQNRSVADAKIWFESTNINKNFEILQYTKELLWDDAIVSNGDKGEVIEVPLILQENISTSTNPKIRDYHRLLFIKRENNHYETKYIQVFTADSTYNNLDKKFNYYSIKDNFNGSIYVLNGNAKSGTSLKFKKSKRIIQNITAKFNEPEEATCLYVGWSYPDGSFEPIMLLGCYGGTGGGGDLESEYFPETTEVYGGAGPGGTTTTTEPVVILLEEVIIDNSFKNNPCLKNVYDKLGGSPTFQNYLKQFDGDFSIADLKLSVGIDPNYPNATAVTYEPINSLFEIKFNPDKLYTPSLDIARTFMHEMIHAEMYRKLLTLSGKKEIPWSLEFIESIRNDEEKIADYYTRYRFDIPAGESPSEPQHEYMAELSRDIITETMKQYDNMQSEDVYNALSWIGLMGTGDINNNTGLPPQPTAAWVATPQAERLTILQTYYNYINNNLPCQ